MEPTISQHAANIVQCRKSNKQTSRLFVQNFSWHCSTQVLTYALWTRPFPNLHNRCCL